MAIASLFPAPARDAPLVWSTFQSKSLTADERLAQTIHTHPEIVFQTPGSSSLEHVTHEQILGMLPEHKYDGAFLSHETQAHWLLAIFSAAAFMALALFMFPAATRRFRTCC